MTDRKCWPRSFLIVLTVKMDNTIVPSSRRRNRGDYRGSCVACREGHRQPARLSEFPYGLKTYQFIHITNKPQISPEYLSDDICGFFHCQGNSHTPATIIYSFLKLSPGATLFTFGFCESSPLSNPTSSHLPIQGSRQTNGASFTDQMPKFGNPFALHRPHTVCRPYGRATLRRSVRHQRSMRHRSQTSPPLSRTNSCPSSSSVCTFCRVRSRLGRIDQNIFLSSFLPRELQDII